MQRLVETDNLNVTRRIVCKRCDGRGWIETGDVRRYYQIASCPKCNGKGDIARANPQPITQSEGETNDNSNKER